MIQKNRIMTKKGIIIFDRNIDVEKTQKNWIKSLIIMLAIIKN